MASVAGPRPAGGVHLSGFVVQALAVRPSGVRPLRCPVTRVRRPGSGVRPSGVHPSGVHPSGVHPVRPNASGWSPTRRWRWGQADAARQPPPRERVEVPAGCRAASSSGSVDSRVGPDAGDAAGVARGRPGLSVVDPGRVGCGRRPRLTLPPRQARPACRAPVAGGCARAGRRPQREVAVPAAWLPPSGWVGDHGAWWSWRPARRVDGPGGPMRVEPGIGVRPQRGPGWQRALPARYRQRCDLR
jgi:hypothetical protein